jgi:DNA-binding transcriptional LysR family regulator
LATPWLVPRPDDFPAASPEVDLRVLTGVWPGDGDDAIAELEIRHDSGHWDGHTSERLSREAAAFRDWLLRQFGEEAG